MQKSQVELDILEDARHIQGQLHDLKREEEAMCAPANKQALSVSGAVQQKSPKIPSTAAVEKHGEEEELVADPNNPHRPGSPLNPYKGKMLRRQQQEQQQVCAHVH